MRVIAKPFFYFCCNRMLTFADRKCACAHNSGAVERKTLSTNSNYCIGIYTPKFSESTMGFRTIKDGEQALALILNNQDPTRLVVGPNRVKKDNYVDRMFSVSDFL
jgi:hypothetical protein